MAFSKEQRREAYQKLSEGVKDFVTSNETLGVIEGILQKSGLEGDQAIAADSEILFAMFGLQTLDQAITNITLRSAEHKEQFTDLKSSLQKEIFDQIDRIAKKENGIIPEKAEPTLQTIPEIKPSEKISLAPSVVVEKDLPMIVPTEKAKVALTFEERKKLMPLPPDNKHHYQDSKDPYREPI